MKNLFITLLFLISAIYCFAQDDCNLQRNEDKFENKVAIYTSFGAKISCSKHIEYGKVTTYLSLNCYGSTLNIGEKGAFVLFEDGTKWAFKTAEIDVEPDEAGWEYSAFIPVNSAQLDILSKKKITDIKLYIYSTSISQDVAKMFNEEVACLKVAK